MISPAHLKELGLLKDAELNECPVSDEEHIDYGVIIPWKHLIFRLAHTRFLAAARETELARNFHNFCREQDFWLTDYALFMACKDKNNGKSWLEWEEEYRNPTPQFKESHNAVSHPEAGGVNVMEKVSLLLLEEMVDSCLKVGRRLSSVSAASPFAVQSRSSI